MTDREHPDLNRNQLKKQYSKLWQRLYRRDKNWLAANAPPLATRTYNPHKQPPAKLLENLSAATEDVAEQCFNQDSFPINGSKHQLRQMTGVSEYVFNTVMAKKLISPQRHTRDETNRKRIKLAEERSPTSIADSTLAKEANLRPTTVAPLRNKNR